MKSLRHPHLFLIVVTIISVLFYNILLLGRPNETLAERLESDLGDGNGHVLTALTLLKTGSFGDESHPFFGEHQEGPPYRILLAGAFAILGETLWAVYILNTLLLVGAVLLLYRISKEYLPGTWALAPPLLLAGFWGAASYVFHPNTEPISLFLILLFLMSIFRYTEGRSLGWASVAGFIFACLVLQKPVLEYFYPILLLGFVWGSRPRFTDAVWPLILIAVTGILIVGSWHVHNYRTLGDAKLSSAGPALVMRTESASYTGARLQGFLLASFSGSYVADALIPAYQHVHEPEAARTYKALRRGLRASGMSEAEVNREFLQKAYKAVSMRPVQYVLMTPFWLLRLNGPVNIDGSDMDNFGVGNTTMPAFVAMAGVLGVRLLWYIMIAAALIGAIQCVTYAGEKRTRVSLALLCMLALIVYINGMYALVSHAEVRYLLPVMPLYFLFAVLYVHRTHVARAARP